MYNELQRERELQGRYVIKMRLREKERQTDKVNMKKMS